MQILKDVPKEILEAAKMAEFLRAPETDAAKKFVKALVEQTLQHEATTNPRQRKRRKKDIQNFESALAAYLGDLLYHMSNDASDGFMYRPSDRELLAETLVSSRHFDQLTELWRTMKLIEVTGYFQAKTDFEGPTNHVFLARARRIRGTPKLLEMASSFDMNPDTIRDNFPKQSHLIQPVTVRDERYSERGLRLASRNLKLAGPEYQKQIKLVERLNQVYALHSFNLADQPRLYRLFNRGNFANFDFNMGGRLYCASDDNWQSKDQELRRFIKIDGEPTVELDVRASHLAILYGLKGKHLNTRMDPYQIDGVEREVVKMAFTAWCGLGKPPVRWPKKQVEKYAQRHGYKPNKVYKLKNVVSALRNRHPVLEKIKWGSLDWSKLQFVESECFLSTMLELARNFEVPALPVHDSLIVRERDAELVKDILGNGYHRRLGFRPVIREV